MYVVLEVLTVMLASVTMSLALAHALELPGKLRLSKEQYLVVQTIYYPGFTLGGIAEIGSILAAFVLLMLTPRGAAPFLLIAAALAALIFVQVIFWTMTQPVNKYWLEKTELSRVASRFFDTAAGAGPADWTVMRYRWELSHVLRAVAATVALLLLVTAVAL